MRHGEEMLLAFAEGTPVQRDMFQAALDRWWLPALHCSGPPSKPDDVLLRWRIKSERNEDLRDQLRAEVRHRCSPATASPPPDPDLRRDPETGRWEIGRDRLVAAQGDARQPRPRHRPPHRRRRPPLVRHRAGCATRSRRSRVTACVLTADRPDGSIRRQTRSAPRWRRSTTPSTPASRSSSSGWSRTCRSTRRRGSRSIWCPTFSRMPGARDDRRPTSRAAVGALEGVERRRALPAPHRPGRRRASPRRRGTASAADFGVAVAVGPTAAAARAAVPRAGRAVAVRPGAVPVDASLPGCGEAVEMMR